MKDDFQLILKRVIKHYSSLRNRTFSKDIAAIIRDSSDGSEQSKLKCSGKRVHLVDAITRIYLWLHWEGQNVDINMSLEEVDYSLHEEFKTAVEDRLQMWK